MRNADFAGIGERIGSQGNARCAHAPELTIASGPEGACYRWRSTAGALFVKTAPAHRAAALDAEAQGLTELAGAHAVRVPRVIAGGVAGAVAFLATEWIDSHSPGEAAHAALGEQLAAQHRVTTAEFGWHRDNTIGRTPQMNGRMADWVAFFRERRLRFQFELALANGHGPLLQPHGERLLESLEQLFTGYCPVPSLLHGDLWGGNWLAGTAGEPVIFDPAVYYGDREADIAMTHLFGGFSDAFYQAYERCWPLDPGHAVRRDLYNLYHLLNHANLFGGGYARQARAVIDRLLAHTGG